MAFTDQRITKLTLENALFQYLKVSVKIIKFETSKMTSEGQNYAGDLLRVRITYSDETNKSQELSMVAKCFPEDENLQVHMNDLKCFDTEIQVYDEFLPATYNLNYRQKCCPNLIYVLSQPKPIIFLEDLSELGYAMQKREVGLDLNQCLMVVQKLAYFHACSVAVYETDPTIVEKYKTGHYFKIELCDSALSILFEAVLQTCQRYTGLQQYVDKLRSLQESFQTKVYATSGRRGGFNVLNHGDLWTTNIMFAYTEDQMISDVAFVDFQFSIFGSPALDLHCLLASSVAPDIREQSMDTIIGHYFKELLRNLSRLNVNTAPPTYEEFYKDFQASAIYGLAATITTATLAHAPKRDDASIINHLRSEGEDSFQYQCLNNKNYLKNLECLLPFYDRMGIFD